MHRGGNKIDYVMRLTWEQICEDPLLKDLPYKIEQDRHGHIVMSPAKSDHGEYQAAIAALLKTALPEWSILVESGIETTEGVKVPDVAAMTKERRLPSRGSFALPVAPEICVEIESGSNTEPEYLEKRQLYAAKGCLEFWRCSEEGLMKFQEAQTGMPLERSVLCPTFPDRVEI